MSFVMNKRPSVGRARIFGRVVLALTTLLSVVVLCVGCCRITSNKRGEGAAGDSGPVQVIENKGSDTMVNLALAWAEAYMAVYPDVRISVTGGGSGTGIAALINGTVDMVNASRAMKDDEWERARANGIEPVEHVVAMDAIAVVVNPQNPVEQLTIPQLSAMFTGRINNWTEVGGVDRPIVLLSRESNSGTYVYFLEHVIRYDPSLQNEFFSPDTLLLPSSEGISNEVRQNPNVIGYDGLGYVTPDQKTLKIAAAAGKPYIFPTEQTVHDGTYPIARPLYVYTSGEPTGALQHYLQWIRGPEGQALVAELGFVPYARREE